jgi:hypothetical protein
VATAASSAFSARRSTVTWRAWMRSAASAAISPSSARRTSTTCTTASIESSTVGSKLSGWCAAASATYTPEPWRERSRPLGLELVHRLAHDGARHAVRQRQLLLGGQAVAGRQAAVGHACSQHGGQLVGQALRRDETRIHRVIIQLGRPAGPARARFSPP